MTVHLFAYGCLSAILLHSHLTPANKHKQQLAQFQASAGVTDRSLVFCPPPHVRSHLDQKAHSWQVVQKSSPNCSFSTELSLQFFKTGHQTPTTQGVLVLAVKKATRFLLKLYLQKQRANLTLARPGFAPRLNQPTRTRASNQFGAAALNKGL